MKTIKTKPLIITYILSFVLSIAGALVLTLAFKSNYDADIQHFSANSPAMIAYSAICLASVVLAVIAFCFTGKNTVFIKKEEFSFTTTFVSVLCACFSIYFGYMTIRNGFVEGKEFLFLVLIVCSFLSGLWFLLDAFGLVRSDSVKILSAAPALMATFLSSHVYFSADYAMNSALKGILVLMTISYMLYFIEYCGTILGAPGAARKYAAASMVSTVIGGSVSLSLLALMIESFSGFNYNLLTVCMYVSFWVISGCSFLDLVLNAKAALPEEEPEDEEITCTFKSETDAAEKDETNDDKPEESDESETSDGDSITAEAKTEDEEEYYTDEDDGEDIHLPPMEFDEDENK